MAGFAFIILDVPKEFTVLSLVEKTNVISDFFIMRNYRGKGVGKKVAFSIFDQFRGSWEIKQTLEMEILFDISVLTSANKIQMLEIGERGSRDSLKIEITNHDITQVLLEEMEGGRFRQTKDSRPSSDNYLLYSMMVYGLIFL
nr:hypothetical protein [Alkaliphilus sp. B6464]